MASTSFIQIPSKKLAAACNAALLAHERQLRERYEARLAIEMNRPPLTWWGRATGKTPPAIDKNEAAKRFSQNRLFSSDELLQKLLVACRINPFYVEVSIEDLWAFEKFYNSDHT